MCLSINSFYLFSFIIVAHSAVWVKQTFWKNNTACAGGNPEDIHEQQFYQLNVCFWDKAFEILDANTIKEVFGCPRFPYDFITYPLNTCVCEIQYMIINNIFLLLLLHI